MLLSCLMIRKKSDQDEMTVESQRRMCNLQEQREGFSACGRWSPQAVLA